MSPNHSVADSPRRSRFRKAVILTVIITGLLGTYVLSYPPIYRITGSRYRGPVVYRPVEWLIDRTPLGGPLLRWSAFWGVRQEMQTDYGARELDRSFKLRGLKFSPD